MNESLDQSDRVSKQVITLQKEKAAMEEEMGELTVTAASAKRKMKQVRR